MGKTIGVILMIIGIALLVWTGVTYTKEEKLIDAGPIQITADREKTINWPPYLGAIVLIGGTFVFFNSKKKA